MSKIMTLDEVAAYLRVSEDTVIKWAEEGEIPGGQLGDSWRFIRNDIEHWAESKLSTPMVSHDDDDERPISRYLERKRVFITDFTTKDEILRFLVSHLASVPGVQSDEELIEGIYHRESLMATGLGNGLAVPHSRFNTLRDVYMAVALNKNPLTDYESLDNSPVHCVTMVIMGTNCQNDYVRLLAMIAPLFKDEDRKNEILRCKSEDELYSHIITG